MKMGLIITALALALVIAAVVVRVNYGVALTQRENIAVYVRHVNDGFAPILKTYSTFEEAGGEGIPGDILATAAAKISDGYVQKMDI